MRFFKKSKNPIRLKNIKVKNISILIDDVLPCNDQPVILKNDDGTFTINATVVKFEPKGILTIRPIISDTVDYDNEFYTKEDVIQASYDTVKEIQKNGGMLFDINHDFESRDNIYYVETYITKDDEGKTIWEMKLDISENEELMEKGKAGAINGVSIAGKVDKVDKSLFNEFLGKSKTGVSDIKKDFNSIIEDRLNNDVWVPMDALWSSIWEAEDLYLYKDYSPDNFKKEIKKICGQFVKHINGMTFERIVKQKESNKGEVMEEQEVKDLIKKEFTDFFAGDEFAGIMKSIIPDPPDDDGEEEHDTSAEDAITSEIATLKEKIKTLEEYVAGDAGGGNPGEPEPPKAVHVPMTRKERAASSIV